MTVQIRASSMSVAVSTSVVIPASVQVGDLLLLHASSYSTQPTVPSGWTVIQSTSHVSSYYDYAWVAYKVAVAGDAGSTVTVANMQSNYCGLEVVALYGHASTGFINASNNGGGNTSPIATGFVGATATVRRFVFASQMSDNGQVPVFTPPAGVTVIQSMAQGGYHRSAAYALDAQENAGTLASVPITTNLNGGNNGIDVAITDGVKLISLPYVEGFEDPSTIADMFDESDGGEATWTRDTTTPFSGSYQLRNSYAAGGHNKRFDKFKLPAGTTAVAIKFTARANGLTDSWTGGPAGLSESMTVSLWNDTDSVEVPGSQIGFGGAELATNAAAGGWLTKAGNLFAVDPSKVYRWRITPSAWSGQNLVDIDNLTLVNTLTNTPAVDATVHGSQRKIDRTQNAVLVMAYKDTENNAKFKYSANEGVAWTAVPAMDIQGATDVDIFVDLDDYLNVTWIQADNRAGRTAGYIYYMRGTPNAGRTAWTWGTAVRLYVAGTVWNRFPNHVVHREGTGWTAHVVFSVASGTTSAAVYQRVDIASNGSMTVPAHTDLWLDFTDAANHTYPTVDFNHTGDAKTVAGGTPHVYTAWSAVKAGAGYGIRFAKAVYAGGAWTWNPVREIDPNIYVLNYASSISCLFDGTRVMIGVDAYDGAAYDLNAYERDAADTTTTTYALAANHTTGGWFAGGMTYDGAGNLYFIGRPYDTLDAVGYMKATRANGVLSPQVVTDIPGNTGTGEPYVSVKRGFSNSKVEWIYTAGNNAPYSVRYDGIIVSSAYAAGVSLNAPASLSSFGLGTTFGAGTLSAPGSLSTDPTRITPATVPLNAPAALSAGATPVRSAAVNLNAPGRLTGFTGQTANVLLNAPAALTMAATRTTFGGVSLAAPGALSTGATRVTTASLALSAPGALSVTAARTTYASLSLNAPAVMTSITSRVTYGAGTLSAPGALTVGTARTTYAAVVLNAPANLTSGPVAERFGGVSLLAPAALTSNPTRIAIGAINLFAPGALTSGPQVWRTGFVNLLAPGSLTSNPIQLRVYIRDPASGLLKSCIVMARKKGTDPFSLADVRVRQVGTDPFTVLPQGADIRELEIGQGPIYSDVNGFSATYTERSAADDYEIHTLRPVGRLVRTPGIDVGWGAYIAAGIRGGDLRAGSLLRIRWYGRGEVAPGVGFDTALEITNDPATNPVGNLPVVSLTKNWKRFTQDVTLYGDWISLDSSPWTGTSQRLRYSLPGVPTAWTEYGEVTLEVLVAT